MDQLSEIISSLSTRLAIDNNELVTDLIKEAVAQVLDRSKAISRQYGYLR